jgi:hypothetical protein
MTKVGDRFAILGKRLSSTAETRAQDNALLEQHGQGHLTGVERYNKILELDRWSSAETRRGDIRRAVVATAVAGVAVAAVGVCGKWGAELVDIAQNFWYGPETSSSLGSLVTGVDVQVSEVLDAEHGVHMLEAAELQ